MSPLCPPEALQNAEQQETSAPEQTGPAVHPLHNNITTSPTTTAAPDTCTHEHLHAETQRKTPRLVAAVQTQQFILFSWKLTQPYFSKLKPTEVLPVICGCFHSIAVISS